MMSEFRNGWLIAESVGGAMNFVLHYISPFRAESANPYEEPIWYY